MNNTIVRVQKEMNEQLKAEGLADLLVEPIQLFELPYKKSATETFLIAWVYYNKQMLDLSAIVTISKFVVGFFAQQKWPATNKGVEIVHCLRDEAGDSDRIVRVSVHVGSIDGFQQLPPERYFVSQPLEGVVCGWYWEPRSLGDSVQ
jgi:hypothetical protein